MPIITEITTNSYNTDINMTEFSTNIPPVSTVNWTDIFNYTTNMSMTMTTTTTIMTASINSTNDTIDVVFFTSMRMSLPFVDDYNDPNSNNYTILADYIRVYVSLTFFLRFNSILFTFLSAFFLLRIIDIRRLRCKQFRQRLN
jgi:hypothetical protein